MWTAQKKRYTVPSGKKNSGENFSQLTKKSVVYGTKRRLTTSLLLFVIAIRI